MLLNLFMIGIAHASSPMPYVDSRFVFAGAQHSLPVGKASEVGMYPQRVLAGAEWFYGPQRLRIGANLHESFHGSAPETFNSPQLWDAKWSVRASDQVVFQVGRQELPIGLTDAAVETPSIQPHSLSQLMNQTQFRVDGVGMVYTASSFVVEPMVSSVGQDVDQQFRMLLSTRLSHQTNQHDYGLSVAYKANSQDPFLVLALTHDFKSLTFGVSGTTGANNSRPFFGLEGRLQLKKEVAHPNIDAIVISERTAYLSPTGALRDLQSKLQSDNSIEIVCNSPVNFGLSYSLFYPINATVPIIHRYSAQLRLSY